MITKEQFEELTQSWDWQYGFLGKLRQGIFDQRLFDDFLALLRSIQIHEDTIPTKVVSLLWFIPLVMDWQGERVEAVISKNDYGNVISAVVTELERILGIP